MIDRTTLRSIAHLSFSLKAARERRAGTIQRPEVLPLFESIFCSFCWLCYSPSTTGCYLYVSSRNEEQMKLDPLRSLIDMKEDLIPK